MPLRSVLSIAAVLISIAFQSSAAEIQLIDQSRRVSAAGSTQNQNITTDAGYWLGDESITSVAAGRVQQESTISTTGISGSSTLSQINFGSTNLSGPILTSELMVVFSVSEATTARLTGTLSRDNTAVANNVRLSFDSSPPELPDYLWRLTDDVEEVQINELLNLTPGSYQLRAYGYTLHSVPGDSSRTWSFDFATVPEPSSLALLAFAGLLLGRRSPAR